MPNNVGMKTTQYTIRSVPTELDSFLRREARLRGKSLNQTVLDNVKQATKLDMAVDDDNLDWFLGTGALDDESLEAIAELKEIDKSKRNV